MKLSELAVGASAVVLVLLLRRDAVSPVQIAETDAVRMSPRTRLP